MPRCAHCGQEKRLRDMQESPTYRKLVCKKVMECIDAKLARDRKEGRI